MVKNYFNMIFLIIIVTIFLFFLCSPNIHGFRTPMPTNPSRQNRVFVTPGQPYYITPSNVRVVPSDPTPSPREESFKNGFFVGRESPTGSITASTVFGVPTEFPREQIFNEDPNSYFKHLTSDVNQINTAQSSNKNKVENDNSVKDKVSKRKESVGERICRRIFNRFVSSKMGKTKEVMGPIRPNFLKNPKTGCNLELDMFEAFDDNLTNKNDITDGIAIEYNGLQHDQFVPGMHVDNDAFLQQQYRDQHKASICKQKGIILIIVDTKTDVSRILNPNVNSKKKYINLTEDEREKTIESYLLPQLETAYKQLMYNRYLNGTRR